MIAMGFSFFLLFSSAWAGPVDDCQTAANAWIDGLKRTGCPPLSRYREAATKACNSIPEDGWNRTSKPARKRLLKECAPSLDGFPGVRAKRPDGRTISACSEMILMMRGLEVDAPTIESATMGIDGMAAAVGAALFACTEPEMITNCRLPASIHTDGEKLKQQIEDCQAIQNPPFDTTMRSLIWNSGLIPVDPDKQTLHLEQLLTEQIRLKEKKEKELADFRQAREDELKRAQELAKICMATPGDMETADAVDQARSACIQLSDLWVGKDAVRQEIEAQGVLAEQYKSRLNGKVLNGESLNVADELRVAARPEILKTRKQDVVAIEFEALIKTDTAAAEALINKHRDDLDPEWLADAMDQILAATM